MLKLTSILTEIADSAHPFKFEKEYEERDSLSTAHGYTFSTGAFKYHVKVDWIDSYRGAKMVVSFKTDESDYTTTEEGLSTALRVMSTVQEILKAIIERHQTTPSGIIFYLATGKRSGKEGGQDQRAKLYLAYIKKAYPQAKVQRDGERVEVTLQPDAQDA